MAEVELTRTVLLDFKFNPRVRLLRGPGKERLIPKNPGE
jgi:hypothetical protein